MSIRLRELSKSYRSYSSGWARLREIITHQPSYQDRQVLAPVTLDIGLGEVVGVVGVNGAGKSTLLKLIAGTLKPTSGSVTHDGQLCALLELGAGFHPEMTGRENIYLGGAVAGQRQADTQRLFDDIVSFAGLREVIDQPVKTYSSGMLMRLAFSVATAVDPDILILDETLSVGDGIFARKSFERIMGFKKAGKTILFCSHSMYQVEAICSRVLWLDHGRLMMDGEPAEVIKAYNAFMADLEGEAEPIVEQKDKTTSALRRMPAKNQFRISRIQLKSEGGRGSQLKLVSKKSDLQIQVDFQADPTLPSPSLGVTLSGSHGRPVTSASSLHDGIELKMDEQGQGSVCLNFPRLPLLRGHYWVNVYLMCEQGLHMYERAERVAELDIDQNGPELGVVSLPRSWLSVMGTADSK